MEVLILTESERKALKAHIRFEMPVLRDENIFFVRPSERGAITIPGAPFQVVGFTTDNFGRQIAVIAASAEGSPQ